MLQKLENRGQRAVTMADTAAAAADTYQPTTASATAAMTVQDDREARFLASQSARIAAATAASSVNKNEDTDKALIRSEFWSAFREHCSSVRSEIDAMLSPPGSTSASYPTKNDDKSITGDENTAANIENAPQNTDAAAAVVERYYATSSARAEASKRLDAILQSIRALERHCLGHAPCGGAGSGFVSSGASPTGEDRDQTFLPPLPDVLPPGDVRLLSEEISNLKKRVDEARDVICPPELFVFRKYRALMAAREGVDGKTTSFDVQAEKTNASADIIDNDEEGDDDGDDDYSQYGSSIWNKSDCTIHCSERWVDI